MDSETGKKLHLFGAWALILAPIEFVIAMAVEEALRPGYSPVSNVISDLGVDINGWSYSWIFNSSVIILGILTMVATLCIWDLFPKRATSTVALVFLFLAGLGAMLVGFFPEHPASTGKIHGVAAAVAFIAAGISMLLFSVSFFKTEAWKKWAIPTLIGGLFDLVSIVLFEAGPSSVQGLTERMIVAPVLIFAPLLGYRFLTQDESAPPRAAAA